MLLTVAVIVWAYGMYALYTLISHRRSGRLRGRLRGRNRGRRHVGLIMGSGLAVGLGVISWLSLFPDREDPKTNLAGFLGTVYAEGYPHQVEGPVAYPLEKSQRQSSGEQPVYALLHPETPTSQLQGEKKALRPRPGKLSSKMGKSPSAENKGLKPAPPPPKKEKVAAKNLSKKKNRASVAGKKATSG